MAAPNRPAPTPPRPRIGDLLVQRGFVTKEQVQECLKIQRAQSQRQELGQILLRKGYLKLGQLQAILREQHGQAPRRRPAARKSSRLAWIVWSTSAALVAALGGFLLFIRPDAAPPFDTSKEGTTPPPASPVRPERTDARRPPARRMGLEAVIEEVEALRKEGKVAEAIQKLDAFDVRNEPNPQAAEDRIYEVRKELEKGAEALTQERIREAEALVAQDKFQDAVERFYDLEKLQTPQLLKRAYARLRVIAADRAQVRRAAADKQTRQALAKLREQYAAARPPQKPQEEWSRAEQLVKDEKWAEAVEALTALASIPDWKARALPLRARAHFASENFVGVLLDVQLLAEGGAVPSETVELLNRSLPRAPIDETVLRIYDECLKKNPNEPAMWIGMAEVYTLRGDSAGGRGVYDLALQRRAQLNGPTRDRMTRYLGLEVGVLDSGDPVFIQYAGPYEILTDTGAQPARDLAKLMLGISKEYSGIFPPSRNPNSRFQVVYFRKWKDYDRYCRQIGQDAEHAVAFYMPGIKRLVVHGDPQYLPPGPNEFEETVRHEAFHQFLDCYAEHAPPWFNEGSATFFERSAAGKPVLDPRWHLHARAAINKPPPLRELIAMDDKEWHRDPERMRELYDKAWSFIYFLHRQGRAAMWGAYLKALILGASAEEAFRRVFSREFEALEEGWKRAVIAGEYGR